MTNRSIDRRTLVLGGLALAGLPAAARAEGANRVTYNFGSTFSSVATTRAARYGGKKTVAYATAEKPGTIIIDTKDRYLYFVLGGGKAIRYGVGVGRDGFRWSGIANIHRKQEWPDWHPPKEMIAREQQQYGRTLPEVMEGGPNNPLGARAMYLFEGNKDTLYRIHGTNQPQTIRQAVSSGCIRMVNDEVIDLYSRVKLGAKVIVL